MEHSLRPYVGAGIALAGAGLIAVIPVGAPALDVQKRAVQLASVDGLAADMASALAVQQEYPVSTLADALTNTFSNLESLGSDITSDPTPILTAIMDNQEIYANDLATAAETAGTNLVNALQDFPTVLSNAVSDLASGNVFDAETSISQFFTQAPLSVLHALNNGFFEVAQSITNNLDNVLEPNTLAQADTVAGVLTPNSVPEWYTEIVEAQLLAPHAAELAVAGVSQDIVNALQDGNSTLAFDDLVNAPSTILDAYFNGYNVDDGARAFTTAVDAVPAAMRSVSSEGLLSENGTIATIREAEETIAQDISPARLREAASVADPTTAASAAADTHTLVADLSTLLSPDTALGELATAFDPNAVADITSLLTADLAPNASGWVVDLFQLF